MAAWQDRLQEEIVLTSPTGTEFRAKWQGNDRSGAKKLGLFDYPEVLGTVSQDLNSNSRQYPLTIFFDGENHDLTADEFFTACEEVGIWQVQHPVYGPLALQLEKYTQIIQPTKNGGITKFELSMFEPVDAEVIESDSQLKSGVKFQLQISNENAINSFNTQVQNASVSSTTAMKSITGVMTDAVELGLSPITTLNSAINESFNAIIRGIDETLNATFFEPLQLAGQLVNLTQLPGQVVTSTQQKLNRYDDLANEIFGITSDDPNALRVKELVLGSLNSAYALIGSESDAVSRTETINQLLGVGAYFDNIVSNLEIEQAKFDDSPIEDQYISLNDTFSDYWLTSAKSIRAMLNATANLAIEKRFTIKEYRLPLDIVIQEYNDDSQLDFFYETNEIGEFDFLLLKPGTEVVVYKEVA